MKWRFTIPSRSPFQTCACTLGAVRGAEEAACAGLVGVGLVCTGWLFTAPTEASAAAKIIDRNTKRTRNLRLEHIANLLTGSESLIRQRAWRKLYRPHSLIHRKI